MNTKQKQEMLCLIEELNQATIAYDKGSPIISDKEWDDMYFKLKQMEEETGIICSYSPTQNIYFEKVSELKKVKHNHPMLSLDKTKDFDDIKSFVKGHEWIAMAKMDGLTCSLRYLNGKLVSAETRGNGIEGEDVTHNALAIPSIPNQINYEKELIVDGEIICTYKDFESFKKDYKNPRNFASGSIRLLDSKECNERKLTFVAWDMIAEDEVILLCNKLVFLQFLGFNIVPYITDEAISEDNPLNVAISFIKDKTKEKSYPIDGIVFKYDNVKEYEAAGRTDHHFKGGLAYKFYDETYETNLKNIEWTMGRTGVLTPVAIFNPINIDGSTVERASLHNVSIMHETLGDCAYIGEFLQVAKMNMIIPQIIEAGPKYNYEEITALKKTPANDVIEKCPICGYPVSYKKDNGIIRVYCDNLLCNGKLINRLDHFCGKKGLDIKGLSKATLEKLINWGWIESTEDIFKLYNYQNEWINKAGFGKASVSKILNAIDTASECSMDKYISALGIPLIGKVASEALTKTFKTYNNFREAIENKDEELYQIAGIGEVMIDTLLNYDYTEADNIFKKYIKEKESILTFSTDEILKDKVFCITGKIKNWKNRDELKSFIESKGGKVTGSVTSKTTYLINNDTSSKTAKNLTAIKLNVPIINEDEFLILVTPLNENTDPSYLNSAT